MGERRFEILDGLPPNELIYKSITNSGDLFFSEGYIIRFYKSNGKNWLANIKAGWTDYYGVFDFPQHDITIVIAGGLGYIMSPNHEKPKAYFGLSINNVIQNNDGHLICSDDTHIIVLDSKTGDYWKSGRVSWDGIKDLKLSGNKLEGQSYDPTNIHTPWVAFVVHLDTKEIEGGSFQTFLENNLRLDSDNNAISKKATILKKKYWWQLWK